MIATVTLNPAMDKTMIVPHFAAGRTNRGRVERVDLGGKGINVARAARHFGCPVLALGFLASSDGHIMREALTAAGIAGEFVSVPGETRVNLKIKDPAAGTETEINEPGFQVGAEHLKRLEDLVRQHAGRCSVMVFSGSLPPGVPPDVYATFIQIAKQSGARTILDTAGDALRNGVAAHPDLIKPNRAEAEDLLGTHIAGDADLPRVAGELLAPGPRMVVVSLGKDGAFAAAGGKFWRAWPPAIEAASSIAAGDCMVAALAYAMVENLSSMEALRLAVAAGTATAAMSGSNVAGRDAIDAILPEVVVEEMCLAGRIGG